MLLRGNSEQDNKSNNVTSHSCCCSNSGGSDNNGSVCMYICMCACVHMCVHVCVHVCVHACVTEECTRARTEDRDRYPSTHMLQVNTHTAIKNILWGALLPFTLVWSCTAWSGVNCDTQYT